MKSNHLSRASLASASPEPASRVVPAEAHDPSVLDLAGERYWESNWTRLDFRHPIDPRDCSLNNHVNRAFHRWFVQAFQGRTTAGLRLLEVGCGSSEWLPYLAKEFGFQVSGLDYSEKGCALASEILAAEGVPGHILHGDLFSPPEQLFAAFDVVVSFGVVEHFLPTERCLRALARFMNPTGRLISVIPNLSGVLGPLQNLLDREVRRKHVTIDRESFAVAHRRASLKPLSCEYQILCNLGVLNAEKWSRRPSLYWLIERLRSAVSKFAWIAEAQGHFFKPNGLTSPYIFCLAERDTVAS